MSEVVDLSARRPPVNYTVRIVHHWDDTLEYLVEDVSDSDRSRAAVIDALQRIGGLREAADGLLAIMLANIDSAMSATDEQPAVFQITPQELSSWADAVQAYETARFPVSDQIILDPSEAKP